MKFALKLDTEGEIHVIEFPAVKGHEWYAEQIGCEWIEIVHPRGWKYTLVVDEEGLLNEKEVNPYASMMYGIFEHGEPIVGDALLMKEGIVNGEHDLVGLSAEEVNEAIDTIMEKRKEYLERMGK